MPEPVSVEWNRRVLVPAAVLLPVLVAAVLSLWRDTIDSATGVLLLVMLVVAAAASGDRVTAVVTALSGALSFDFFLTQPYLHLNISSANDIEATVLLLVIGLAVTEIALWGRRQQARASRRAGYLDGVLGTAELALVRDEPVEVLIGRVSHQMAEVLGVDRCTFVPGPGKDPAMAVLEHDGTVTRTGNRVNVARKGLPTNVETALEVRWDGELLGHFEVVSASDAARPSIYQRRVAVLLADQVAPLLGQRR